MIGPVEIDIQGTRRVIDLSTGIDISIPYHPSGVEAFSLGHPQIEPVRVGSFVGAVASGGSCNCAVVHFTPHGHGTHTECLGHLTKESITMDRISVPAFMIAELIDVVPEKAGEDQVISRSALQQALGKKQQTPALIIRTLPNGPEKLTRNYSATNPPYLTADAAQYLCEREVAHLLVDLPSLDREVDPELKAHHAFWTYSGTYSGNYSASPRREATITELVYIPPHVTAGTYILNLQTMNLASDATPSRPILFALS